MNSKIMGNCNRPFTEMETTKVTGTPKGKELLIGRRPLKQIKKGMTN